MRSTEGTGESQMSQRLSPGQARKETAADERVLRNKSNIIFSICTGLSALVFVIMIFVAGTYISKNKYALSTDDIVAFATRSLAALALYTQAEVYRRNMLVRLEENDFTRYTTLFCGIILGVLACVIVFQERTWFMLIGLMLFVLFVRIRPGPRSTKDLGNSHSTNGTRIGSRRCFAV